MQLNIIYTDNSRRYAIDTALAQSRLEAIQAAQDYLNNSKGSNVVVFLDAVPIKRRLWTAKIKQIR